MGRPAKAKEANSELLRQENPVNLSEIGNHGAIEQQSERDLALTEFMEDILTIRVTPDKTPGSIPTVAPEVNSVRQNIILGTSQKVKRKYVEALARSRITTYRQVLQNPNDPSSIQMVPMTVLAHDFLVINDPHPDGPEWLQNILDQP